MSNKEWLLERIQEELAIAGRRYERYSNLDSDYANDKANYYAGVANGLCMIQRAIVSQWDEEVQDDAAYT